ncbi:Oidioi.mRNA.OKI2018_I69.chr1.g3179.t1.cds [Oikopleura dioica]|uniref:Oidioi.mRNA.OKI2018_I69.chr1.g3179.t1.cds n=1 Tax=Oikopleura dioica TaxID=34765 RepID=A0ABN7SYQ3_OIKDI|nr:Oidioi.mRNA.OKI2018_I69.chr1.g3179.t1.cds [Oikopleura dioica]
MMSGIPGPPPGGGPLNGSLVNPNSVVTESFSDQNLLPDVQGVKSDVIKPEVTTIKEEPFQPQMINGVLGDGHSTVVPHSQGAQVITSVHHQPQPVQPILKVENSQPNIRQIMPQPQISQPQQQQQPLGQVVQQPGQQQAVRPVGTPAHIRPGIRQVVLSPYLVPFLENSLPLLRRSMQQSGQNRQNGPRPVRPVQQVRIPQGGGPPGTPVRAIRPAGPTTNVVRPNHPQIRLPRNMPNRVRPGQPVGRLPGEPPNKMKITSMDRDEARDDDITDVASMAQIDLANEAEHLNNASTVVGSEVRSAPGGDKAVSVNEQILHKLVGQAASKAGGIQRVTPDGARLMGLALEDHIKTIISKAIHAASHRSIQFKETEHIEKLNDVKSRLKYISDLMVIEKRDADEAEQEQRAKLLRSRKGKDDDPDRDKKKKEAKLKQQQLQDEQQLKQADETALEASRRRPRNVASSSTTVNTSSNRPVRTCRVKIRDLLFCLESDRSLSERARDEIFKKYLK